MISEKDNIEQFLAETKQLNQFFRRFNGEENEKGDRLYEGYKDYRSEKLRRNYLPIIINQNGNISETVQKDFIKEMINTTAPHYLDFHSREWLAEAKAEFIYNGKPETVYLFMTLEAENEGYKWVFKKVFFSPYSALFKLDTTKMKHFLHPLSHELEFMNLRKALKNKEEVNEYAHKDFEPDQLTLFLYELKKGTLKFQTVNNVKFHFFQIPGWYFDVQYFNRAGYNRGWLISNMVKYTSQAQKQDLLDYIFFENE